MTQLTWLAGSKAPRPMTERSRPHRVDEIWNTCMTVTLSIAEGNAAIFFAIDHCSIEVVGINAAKRGTRFEALEPIRQGVRHSFRMWPEVA